MWNIKKKALFPSPLLLCVKPLKSIKLEGQKSDKCLYEAWGMGGDELQRGTRELFGMMEIFSLCRSTGYITK